MNPQSTIPQSNRSSWASVAVFVLILLVVGALSLPLLCSAKPEHRRIQCKYNTRWIILALQHYHDAYGTFPPAFIADDAGRPIHSWRVLILPWSERKDLYEKYRFDEPWNGPNNSLLSADGRALFRCPEDLSDPSNTSYVAVVGPDTAWPGACGTNLTTDFPKGPNRTLMVVETANSGINWMEPRDLAFDTMSFKIGDPAGEAIRSNHFLSGGWPWSRRVACANAWFADWGLCDLTEDMPPAEVRKLLSVTEDAEGAARDRED